MRLSSAASIFPKLVAAMAWVGCTAAVITAFGQAVYPDYASNQDQGVYPASGYQASDVGGIDPTEQEQSAYGPACDGSCNAPLGGLFARLCDPNRCSPLWTFAAEAIVLQRSTTRNQPLFYGDRQTEVLNSQTFNFPCEAGPKLSAIRHGIWQDFDLEVSYFQVDGFAAERSIPGTSYMIADGAGNSFHVADATVSYKSAFYSGEVNTRWLWFDGVTLLGGFRMGQLNEHYRADGTGAVDPVADSVAVNAFNHLYGGQLGADVEIYNMGGPLRINALCKAGAFANYAEYNIRRIDTGYVDDSLRSTRSNHAAFLGEVGLTATYAITERLAFRASYSAVWLEGIALAPEQIGATNFDSQTAVIDTTGGAFYHGGGLGIEYRF